MQAGGGDIGHNAHSILIVHDLHNAGPLGVEIPLHIFLRDALELLQRARLADDGGLDRRRVLPREDDVLEVDEEDLVDFEVEGVLALEILPDGLNGPEGVGDLKGDVVDMVEVADLLSEQFVLFGEAIIGLMDQPSEFTLQLILVEYLLDLDVPILAILLNLLLDDDLHLVQHVLLAEGLQQHLVLLRVGLEQVVDLAEGRHDGELVV